MSSNGLVIALCIIAAVVIILLLLYRHQFLKLKLDNLVLVDGGVGAGKTSLTATLAIKKYKSNLFKFNLAKNVLRFIPPFCWLKKIKNMNFNNPPELYSNIPLAGVKYTPLSREIIERTVSVPSKSVAFFSEMSLVIDSQAIRDPILNERATLCFKLWRHYTHGGSAFIETQSIADNHYSVKRSISRYYYIHSSNKHFPFIVVYRLREMVYSDDGNLVNISKDSAIEEMRLLIVPKKYWKCYDTYAYSGLTDDRPLYVDTRKLPIGSRLKADEIVSFRHFKTIGLVKTKEEVKENEPKN